MSKGEERREVGKNSTRLLQLTVPEYMSKGEERKEVG